MKKSPTDTIAALATPLGRSAIAVLRISGASTPSLLKKHLQTDPFREPRQVHLLPFYSATGTLLDQVVVTAFRAPASYTGEDVGEISCHGSPALVDQILSELLSGGARLAEPGEFTMRAFLNGKMDLLQAEAVRDLIESNTRNQIRMAAQQLEGELSKWLEPVKKELIRIGSHLETTLEFVEDEVEPDTRERLVEALASVQEKLEKLARSFQLGRLVREGVQIAICGRPNVGKSSLFNALLESDRVIVTPQAGTTRDAVGELCEIAGFETRLVDTAGIRESRDEIERLGVERSRREIERSDILLFVVDGSEEWQRQDEEIWRQIEGREIVTVLNKADREKRLEVPEAVRKEAGEVIEVSALTGSGIEDLRAHLGKKIGQGWEEYLEREGSLLTNLRQKRCVDDCIDWLKQARAGYASGLSEEFVLYDLRKAMDSLGELTGEITLDDILEQIFSSFCIGK